MWTLISGAKDGDNFACHKEFLLESDSEIANEPEDQQPIAPGSVAYTAGLARMWMKNLNGTWTEM